MSESDRPSLLDLAGSADELAVMFDGKGFGGLRGIWAQQLHHILTAFPDVVRELEDLRKKVPKPPVLGQAKECEAVQSGPDRCALTTAIEGRTKRCVKIAGHQGPHSVHLHGRKHHQWA